MEERKWSVLGHDAEAVRLIYGALQGMGVGGCRTDEKVAGFERVWMMRMESFSVPDDEKTHSNLQALNPSHLQKAAHRSQPNLVVMWVGL